MITITPEALDFINDRGESIYLDLPPIIGCCIQFRDCPSVRFGTPYNPEGYEERVIQGVTIYIPHDLPDIPLTVALNSVFGYKRLVVEGWKLA